MSKIDKLYQETTKNILKKGYTYEDPNRKGVYRTELASVNFRHELKDGFPILTLKKTFFKGAVAELLFFLSGSTDIRDLWKRGVNFWDKDWAGFHGFDEEQKEKLKSNWQDTLDPNKSNQGLMHDLYTMGRIYPAQYRDFNGQIDQFANVVKTLKNNPLSTSMIVNAWNPSDLDNMCLPPCHYGFQIIGRPLSLNERVEITLEEKGDKAYITTEEGARGIDLEGITEYGFEVHFMQRSTDIFLGTPINIQYYALLAMLLEQITGHKALAIQGDLKNVHLYSNQIEQANELLTRNPETYWESNVILSDYLKRVKGKGHYDGTNLDEILKGIKVEDFKLDNYNHYPRLKAEMLARD